MAALALLVLPLLILAQAPVPADKPEPYPAWWFEQEVLSRTDTNQVSPVWPGDYPEQTDFGAVNQGHVKWMAKGAYEHLQANLPSSVWTQPPGTDLSNLISGWMSGGAGPDFAAANQGQVKEVARHFYDIFALPEVSYYSSRISGWTYGETYPWPAVTGGDSDFSAVNAGQLKNLFAFDLTGWDPESGLDTDGDNLLDFWEELFWAGDLEGEGHGWADDPDGDGFSNLQEFLGGGDPTSFFNRPGGTLQPVITVTSGSGQTGAPGELLPAPFEVTVTDALTGQPVFNAPLAFAVGAGGGALVGSGEAPPDAPYTGTASLTGVQTDSYGKISPASAGGVAYVFFELPATPDTASTVTVTCEGATAEFTAFTSAEDALAPAAPTFAKAYNTGDGNVVVYWEDESGNESGFQVDFSPNEGVTWSTASTSIAANAVSYRHLPPVDYAAIPETRYRVRAVNAYGQSAWAATGAPINPSAASSDSDLDWDNDGVPNDVEITLGTSPRDRDSDGDGLNDKEDGWPRKNNGESLKIRKLPSGYIVVDLSNKFDWTAGKPDQGHIDTRNLQIDDTGQILYSYSKPTDKTSVVTMAGQVEYSGIETENTAKMLDLTTASIANITPLEANTYNYSGPSNGDDFDDVTGLYLGEGGFSNYLKPYLYRDGSIAAGGFYSYGYMSDEEQTINTGNRPDELFGVPLELYTYTEQDDYFYIDFDNQILSGLDFSQWYYYLVHAQALQSHYGNGPIIAYTINDAPQCPMSFYHVNGADVWGNGFDDSSVPDYGLDDDQYPESIHRSLGSIGKHRLVIAFETNSFDGDDDFDAVLYQGTESNPFDEKLLELGNNFDYWIASVLEGSELVPTGFVDDVVIKADYTGTTNKYFFSLDQGVTFEPLKYWQWNENPAGLSSYGKEKDFSIENASNALVCIGENYVVRNDSLSSIQNLVGESSGWSNFSLKDINTNGLIVATAEIFGEAGVTKPVLLVPFEVKRDSNRLYGFFDIPEELTSYFLKVVTNTNLNLSGNLGNLADSPALPLTNESGFTLYADDAVGNRLHFTVPADPEVVIDIELSLGGADSDVKGIHREGEQPTQAPTYTIPADETAGPRYRKVALNGRPLADSKPQAEAESDEEPEETYVDAMSLQLRHGTTDVYVPVPASDLALTVRRDVAPLVWNFRGGLTPEEEPVQPFGACWNSNLGGHLKITEYTGARYQPDTATVVDENGQTYRFLIKGQAPNRVFFPMPSGLHEQATYLCTLARVNDGGAEVYRFTRRYGTTLTFSTAAASERAIYLNRLQANDGDPSQSMTYHRLTEVSDRYGNYLQYLYPGNNASTLVPETIQAHAPNQVLADLNLEIEQDSLGRVLAVTDPNGNVCRYHYGLEQAMDDPDPRLRYVALEKVERPDGTVTAYEYDEYREAGTVQDAIEHYHVNVDAITDALGRTYRFAYLRDVSKYDYNSGYLSKSHLKRGLPRVVAQVLLPTLTDAGGGQTNLVTQFANESEIRVGPTGGFLTGSTPRRQTSVTDTEGNRREYRWPTVSAQFVSLDDLNPYPDDPNSAPLLIYYPVMQIEHFAGESTSLGTESFVFNVNAGMSLAQVTDFSGNVTSYAYTDPVPASGLFAAYQGIVSGLGMNGYFPDPTSQTNAMHGQDDGQGGTINGTKSFTYSPSFRVMSEIIDEEGRRTTYQVNSLGQRTRETVHGPDETGAMVDLMVTDYAYGDPAFPNFLTSKTVNTNVKANDPAGWAVDLVTVYTSSSRGRVAAETVNPGGLGLTTSYLYDANGNRTQVTDARSHATDFAYDERNRLVRVTYPDGSARRLAYDARGNKTKETDENGHATLVEYDELNRVVRSARDMNSNGVIDAGTDLVTQRAYNAVNSKTGETDPRGYTTTYAYDALQRLEAVTSPPVPVDGGSAVALVTRYFYGGANAGGSAFDVSGFKPTATVDPRGFVTLASYDQLYRPTETVTFYGTAVNPATYQEGDALSGAQARTETEYDAVGNVVKAIAFQGDDGASVPVETLTVYDGLNRPVQVTQAANAASGTTETLVAQSFYTSTGLAWKAVVGVGEPDARTTLTEYDAAGRAVKVIQPLVRDEPSGQDRTPVVSTSYDANGNVTATTNPRGHDAAGNVIAGHTWTSTYDSRNRRVAETQPAYTNALPGYTGTPVVTTVYDAVGNVVRVTDARGHVTTTDYDPANRPFRVTAPAVYDADSAGYNYPVTSTVYDPNGNAVEVTDPRGIVTLNTYDALNRLQDTTQDDGGLSITVINHYDAGGNLVRVTDGLGQKTAYTHDGLGRVLTQTYGEGAANDTTTFTYDAANQRTRLDPNGVTTSYAYDLRSRLTAVTYSPGGGGFDSDRSYAYDAYGNLLGVTEPGKIFAADVAYQYDALDRVTAETSTGQTHTYGYDLAGNRTAVTYGGTGRGVASTYDALNRLETMSEGGRTTNYAYDDNGNIVAQRLPNGDLRHTVFDRLNRAQTRVTTFGDGSQGLMTCSLSYDLAGNVRGLTEAYDYSGSGQTLALPGRTVVNVYDGAGRLSAEHVDTGSDGSVDTLTEYGYDDAHSRTAKTVTTDPGGTPAVTATGYAYTGQVNQLAFIYADANANGAFDSGEAKTAEFTYDANGNRTTRSAGGQTDTYTWDLENRLVNLLQTTTDRGQTPGEYFYGYDYRSRRVLRDEALAGRFTAQVVFAGGTSAWEHYYPQPGTPTVEYLRGSDYGGGVGGILYTLRPDGQGGVTPGYTHSNHRGDVIAKTDAAGLLTWQSQYEAFGTRPDEAENPAAPNLDRQKANSKDEDPTGLLNEGFRYRDLETGTFISRDPLGLVDGPNIYTYVRQNPWSFFDPLGLETLSSSMPTNEQIDSRVSDLGSQINELDQERERLAEQRKAIGGRAATRMSAKEMSLAKSAAALKQEQEFYQKILQARELIGPNGYGTGRVYVAMKRTFGAGYDSDIVREFLRPESGFALSTLQGLDKPVSTIAYGSIDISLAALSFGTTTGAKSFGSPMYPARSAATVIPPKTTTSTVQLQLSLGDNLANPRYLYQKVGPDGEHLKFGMTKNPSARYTKDELAGGRLRLIAHGEKDDILKLERNLHETLPIGPEEGQEMYIRIQVEKGLKPPPYSW